MSEDGATVDYETAKMLTVNTTGGNGPNGIDSNLVFSPAGYEDSGTGDHFRKTTGNEKGTFRIALSYSGGQSTAPNVETFPFYTSNTVKFEVEISVNENIGVDTLRLALLPKSSRNKIFYGETSFSNGLVANTRDKGLIEANTLSIPLKTQAEDNSLESLEVGGTEATLEPVDLTQVPPTYVIDGPMDEIVVKPTPGSPTATVKVGMNNDAPQDPDANGIVKLPVPESGGKIKVTVTSETGIPETYEINVVVSYVRLSNLTAADVGPAEITTLGIQETFDKDTFAYTLNIALGTGDSTITITPTVLAGYGSSQAIAVATTGCTAANTVNSGSALSVTVPTTGGTVTLTATAADGVTTQAYVITIVALSTDTSITAFTVTGIATPTTIYNNDSAKATEKTVDYYFCLENETEVKGIMNITAAAGATIKVGTTVYDDATKGNQYVGGEYVVTVIAAEEINMNTR